MFSYFEKYLIGFSYGLSFPLTIVILDYWLKDLNISTAAIAAFSLLHLPFTFKFVWGVFIENYDVPILSKYFERHFSWLIFSHIILLCGIFLMIFAPASNELFFIIVGASLTALGDGCKNVVLYPYQINDCADKKKYGYIANIVGLGHRLGTIFIKVSMLYVADFWNWNVAYAFAAAMIFVSFVSLCFIKRPQYDTISRANPLNICTAIKTSIVDPFNELIKKNWTILAILIFYKDVDFFTQKMTRLFLIENGFTKTEIANIVQLFGSVAVIVGGFLGGFIIKKCKLRNAMMWLGAAHACVFLLYRLQVNFPHNSILLSLIISAEGLTGGAVTAAFLAFIYTISSSGSLYALLWAIHECSMIFFTSISGIIAQHIGWENFFLITPILFAPNLLILRLRKTSS